MNRILIPVIIVILMVAGYLAFTMRQQDAPPVTAEVQLPPEPKPVVTEQPAPEQQFPVPEPQVTAEPAKPLPVLDESDTAVQQEFSGLVSGDNQMGEMLLFKTFVRNFVVIVDNLTEAKVPQKYMFIKPPAGTFTVTTDESGTVTIAPENHSRYLPFIKLVSTLNTDSLVNVYVYLYPLFQQAYAELGYPDRYFNDRLVEVIDHLLAAPELPESVALVQPKVYYQYADPALEGRSAGQKLLMRVGNENAALLKQKLQEIKTRLTSLQNTLPQ